MHAKSVIVVLLAATVAVAAEPAATPDAMRQLLNQKKWADLLKTSTQALNLRGPAADPYDRYELWTMKAEAQLQGGQITPAAQSFARAAAEPKATPDQIDDAKSMAMLAKKSDVGGYKTPARAGPVRAFDIRDLAKRNDALAALYGIESAELTRRVEQSKLVTEPKPLVELAKAVGELQSLDRVVNKSADQTDAMQTALAGQIVAAAGKWSDGVLAETDRLRKAADESVKETVRDGAGRTVFRQRKRGYQNEDLNASLAMIRKAEAWAETYKAVRQAMGKAGQAALQPAEATIQTTYDAAKALQRDAAEPKAR